METIAERWARFDAEVIAPEAGEAQRSDMERSFYAGFSECLLAFAQAPETDDPEDAIAQLEEEATGYAESLGVAADEAGGANG